MLHVEVMIDKKKSLPEGAAEAVVRLAGMDGLSIRGGAVEDRKSVEEILQET